MALKSFKNFTLKKNIFIKEINSQLIELTHDTNAEIIHIFNKDLENLFSISLQTPPSNSKGIPHILEHMVLCGSKKFKVKDPFFYMRRRSLHTFMNAMTGQDFTCYPASSEIKKDFYNLLKVYADAVFHPLLTKESFLQEGIRLEFQDQNIQKPLQYKGVVFNEMKGANNSLEERLLHNMMKYLTPDLPYSFNAGGETKEISKLSYEEVLQFHEKYYHPSRALFFFYGNIPTKDHLNFLQKNIFEKKEKRPPIKFPIQKKFSSPIKKTAYFPSLYEKKPALSIGWLLCNIQDRKDILALTLLDSILMQTDASILKHALLQSKFCAYAESFLDEEMSQISYTITCKNVEKKEEILPLILHTLKNVQISKKIIAAAFSKLEFSKKEITRDFGPYGLHLFFRCLPKTHGCNTEDLLKITSCFNSLKKDLKNPNFFNNLIKKYFLDNFHRVELHMNPKKDLQEQEKNEELQELKKIKDTLSPSSKKNIVKETMKLKKIQEKKENISSLPKIYLKDIPKNPKKIILSKKYNQYLHKTFTNGILYHSLVFTIPTLPKDFFHLAFLSSIIDEVGCGPRDYKKNLEYIHQHIGSLSSHIYLIPQIHSPTYSPFISIDGKALYEKSPYLHSLLEEIPNSLNLNEKTRIQELLIKQKTILDSSLISNAYSYCIKNTLASLSPTCFINDKIYGVGYYQSLKKNIQKPIDQILSSLQNTYKNIFSHNPERIITADPSFLQTLPSFKKFPVHTQKNSLNDISLPSLSTQGFPIPSNVAFNCMGLKTIGYNHKDSAYLYLTTFLLENTTLHPLIREQKGAYSSSAVYYPNLSLFYLSSYRDPHIQKTLDTFRLSIKKISKGEFTKKDLQEAKLQAIQKLDRPKEIGQKALISFLEKKSSKKEIDNKNFRKKILHAKKEDIQKASFHLNLKNTKTTSFSNEKHLLLEKIPIQNF